MVSDTRAYGARLDGSGVDSAADRTTVVFRRSAAETFFAVVLCFSTVLLTAFALAGAAPPKTAFLCDRAADQCTLTTQALAGRSSTSFRVSELVRSTIQREANDRTGDTVVDWIAKMKDGHGIWLGSGSSGAGGARFEARSTGLTAFIADPTQRYFRAEFQSSGAEGGPIAIAVAIVAAWLAFVLIDGWRTTLEFDRTTGGLGITKSPCLVPPRRRTLPLSAIADFEAKPGIVFLSPAVMQTLTLRLSDTAHKTLFSRRQLTTPDVKREIEEVRKLLG